MQTGWPPYVVVTGPGGLRVLGSPSRVLHRCGQYAGFAHRARGARKSDLAQGVSARPESAVGTSATWRGAGVMAALSPKGDMAAWCGLGSARVHGLVHYICQAPPGQSGLERDQRYACAGVMAPLATSDRSSADCKASAGGGASDFINWISSPFYPARICTPMPRPSEPLPDFIEPELATLVERAPEGDHRQSRRGCVPLRGCKDGGARRQGRRRGRRHLAPDRGGCRGVAADAAAGRSGELTTRRERLGTVPALFQGPAGNSAPPLRASRF